MAQLDKVSVKGFKSIMELHDFPLNNLNIIIGANGSGKSNFLEIFKFLRATMQMSLPGFLEIDLNKYVQDYGGANDLLFLGPNYVSDEINLELYFGQNGYRIAFRPTQDDLLRIDREANCFLGSQYKKWYKLDSSHDGYTPSLIQDRTTAGATAAHGSSYYIYNSIEKWQMYHFHDAGRLAPIKKPQSIFDNKTLRFDGSNLASFLLKLKDYNNFLYKQIISSIQLIAPYFDDFSLIPDKNDNVRLLWKQKKVDKLFKPQVLSDGTLRFICLTTVLLQPIHPETLIIDEPELGFHPQAIAILAELIKARSEDTQLIIATQSPDLISYFEPEDIIIVDRKYNQSTFKRLSAKQLAAWLEDFTLGELWEKNILSGGPKYE